MQCGRGETMSHNALSARSPPRLPLVYYGLLATRLALTLAPQRGYIHPDEYFQNMEVIASDIFSVEASRTWEFNNTFPVRNILIPKITFGVPYHSIKLLSPYVQHLGVDLRSPYFLLVLPRLLFCFLSLINDFCLYKICILFGQNYQNCLKIFASSYIMLVFSCRGFSNSFEMMLFSVLLLLVAECMRKSDKVIYHEQFLQNKYEEASSVVERVKLYRLKTHLPAHSLSHVAVIATVAAVGFFNRPTFLGFAFTPIFFWLQRGLGSEVIGFKDFHYRIATLGACAFPTVLVLIIIDSNYYGYLTLSELESLKISIRNFVLTPFNFLLYNMKKGNLAKHGIHPSWLHFLINLPLLFNVLGIIGLLAMAQNTYRFFMGHYSKLPKVQSITGLMLFSFFTPVALLSLFPHQEARFIIPVLLPLVYLHGNFFFNNPDDSHNMKKWKKSLLIIWYVLNFLLTIFFGFLHQGGIYPLINTLHKEIKNDRAYGRHTHVITSHSYSMPTSLLQLESTNTAWHNKATSQKYKLTPHVFFYEYGSLSMDKLFANMDNIISAAELKFRRSKKSYRVYLAAPCALDVNLYEANVNYTKILLYEEAVFYPHVSTEALPYFPSSHDQLCFTNHNYKRVTHNVKLSFTEQLACLMSRFCLKLYIVTLKTEM